MKRELTKVAEGYKIELVDEELKSYTSKVYTKAQMKDNYNYLMTQIHQYRMQKMELVKNIAKLQVDDSKQLRELAVKIEAAVKLTEYDKLNNQLTMVKEDLDSFAKQKVEIEVKIPEFTRLSN